MSFCNQKVLPAIRQMKDFELLLQSPFEYMVLLDSHIGQLKSIVETARRHNKKMLVHVDLIQGLRNDEYATEFLCREIKPAGVISTRKSAVLTAKKNKVLAVQRFFLLDTTALETSYRLVEQTQPDYIEVLPGVMPHIISEIYERVKIPVLAGGLIRTIRDAELALSGGAIAVTTSRKEIWNHFLANPL
ncbi:MULTISPECIES: glycerol-3-phosphate responsive antiterminator [Aneurinibacillus]|uniref:Glycerol uptake operon antiterminator regulatory protein n=1 Tax=Aneurinibacillus thermoaerophilus TaxID=143495 RepID=A0A1G8C6D6_ANETH|nr:MULTISPECIES: glycerol-3-phosphate responsive antiterminator [Aneurinibacillus]AMA74437.1 glycerol-3-phosphate responsive antiterminator GlpP [Aneurinibacillus sp. XH2]MED0674526.1 glycerol-3-phosphate responsive antiterminator [Aneurinibacillus thermoaerophilus]MED0679167.1 glycerol-3-phosphate responsive antiterminator [Aneurinibacillus thermoaerophilus]MED0738234.1 glycerol-3-phosphate responsive antiterminator [Aneurinibacillus thermoaerophilus]MED0757477.1 glycerol-3-phosphate responsi